MKEETRKSIGIVLLFILSATSLLIIASSEILNIKSLQFAVLFYVMGVCYFTAYVMCGIALFPFSILQKTPPNR